MAWFSPQACGCCSQPFVVCEDHTCTTRLDPGLIRTYDGVDLTACECVDACGNVILRTSYEMTITLSGTATGGTFNIGSTTYNIPNANITGSYAISLSLQEVGTGCRPDPDTTYAYWLNIYNEFIVTDSGLDYYAALWMRFDDGLIFPEVNTVATGNPFELDADARTTTHSSAAWSAGSTLLRACNQLCYCSYLFINAANLTASGGGPHLYNLSSISSSGTQNGYLEC